ncbi:MAG TPA: hypothetical protein VFD92_22950 [Candidatus Binatia bacterium]|nr:hypothetical protein [Candidatus Binatia bacterium]
MFDGAIAYNPELLDVGVQQVPDRELSVGDRCRVRSWCVRGPGGDRPGTP